MTDTLDEIARRCKTDKADKHSYMPVYERIIGHRRDEPLSILEIGVNGTRRGASIRMWLEAFPKATVYGADVQSPPSALRNQPRYHHVTGDAYTEEIFRIHAMNEYDLIIDDGPHLPSTQAFAVEHYSRLLRPGGILVVEDVNLTKYPGAAFRLVRTVVGSELDLRSHVFDLRAEKGRFDDVMFVAWLSSDAEVSPDHAR